MNVRPVAHPLTCLGRQLWTPALAFSERAEITNASRHSLVLGIELDLPQVVPGAGLKVRIVCRPVRNVGRVVCIAEKDT
jgi:hypothetical protein